MTRFKRFYNDTYPYSLVLIDRPAGLAEINTLLHKHKVLDKDCFIDEYCEQAAAAHYRIDNQTSVIVFQDEKLRYSHIAHESAHAAVFFCECFKITIACGDDEPLCYMLEWVMNNILEFIGATINAREEQQSEA